MSEAARSAWASGKRALPAGVRLHTCAGRPTPRGSAVDATSPSAANRMSCCRAASPQTPVAQPNSATVCGPPLFRTYINRSADERFGFSKLSFDIFPARRLFSKWVLGKLYGAPVRKATARGDTHETARFDWLVCFAAHARRGRQRL